MTDSDQTAPPLAVAVRLRQLADEVEESIYAENARGGEARAVLHQLYTDVCADDVAIVGWERRKLQARADRIRERLQRAVDGAELLRELRATLSRVQREAQGLRAEARSARSLTPEQVNYRDRVFAACRELTAELPSGSYSEEGAAVFALKELADLRTKLEASVEREHVLEAQNARLSGAQGAAKAEGVPSVEQLVDEAVAAFKQVFRGP